jgi:methylmalonyl-CoA/ethylmalonyl-CoA epimerase
MTGTRGTYLTALGLKLHHIGIVTDNIDAKRQFYEDVLGYTRKTEIIHDPLATANVQFLALETADHMLELVSPDGPESKLARAAKKTAPLNHLCYSVSDIKLALQGLEAVGSIIVEEPTPAIAFGMRRIAWILSPDCLLIELLEQGGPREI